MSYYISAPLQPYHFANGELPDVTTFGGRHRHATMAECIDQKELQLYQYCGKNIANITLTVDQDIREPFNPSAITHVTVHAYNINTKEIIRYDVDAKDGDIPWEELRKTFSGELYGPDRGRGVYQSPDVGKVRITPESQITLGLVSTAQAHYRLDGYFRSGAYSSIACSRESTEIARINAELAPEGKRFLREIDMNQVYAKYLSSPKTPHELAGYQFAHLTDIASVKMQEVWQSKYTQYLQSGHTENQSYALAMVHTTSAALRGELGPMEYTPEDTQVLQNIHNLAVQEATKICDKLEIQNAQENGPMNVPDGPTTVFGALPVSMFEVQRGTHPCTYRPEIISYYADPELAKTESFRCKYTEGRPELGFVVSTNNPCALTGCTKAEDIPKEADVQLYVSISLPNAGQSQLINVTHMSTEQLQSLAEMTIAKRPISEIQQFIDSTAPGDGTVGSDAHGLNEHEQNNIGDAR